MVSEKRGWRGLSGQWESVNMKAHGPGNSIDLAGCVEGEGMRRHIGDLCTSDDKMSLAVATTSYKEVLTLESTWVAIEQRRWIIISHIRELYMDSASCTTISYVMLHKPGHAPSSSTPYDHKDSFSVCAGRTQRVLCVWTKTSSLPWQARSSCTPTRPPTSG